MTRGTRFGYIQNEEMKTCRGSEGEEGNVCRLVQCLNGLKGHIKAI